MTDEEYNAEVLRRVNELNGGYTRFDGGNCDDCLGWDGLSRRCQCGNRRVSWEEHFGHLYATAY